MGLAKSTSKMETTFSLTCCGAIKISPPPFQFSGGTRGGSTQTFILNHTIGCILGTLLVLMNLQLIVVFTLKSRGATFLL